MLKQLTSYLLACVLLALMSLPGAAQEEDDAAFSILVFSKTVGFRHGSIPEAISAVESLGAENGFLVEATEDAAVFNDANLAQYSAVVFLMTTGDVLNNEQQAAFERYIQAGGGFVGVHSASDTEYSWPWYGQLVGAYFRDHPAIQTAEIHTEDDTHLSTNHLPSIWTRTDEWYNFQTNPRPNVNVLLTLDETTYSGGSMGDHPIAWFHAFDGGRSWYTGGGHTAASYAEPNFRQHLLGGIIYASGEWPSSYRIFIPSIFSILTQAGPHAATYCFAPR